MKGSLAHYAAHAGAGCVSAVAGGGKCGQGAASALVGKFVSLNTEGIGGAGISGDIARGVAASVGGGLASVAGGGKFSSGAETAAFGYMFNECFSGMGCWRKAAEGFGNAWRNFFIDPYRADYANISVGSLSPQGGVAANLHDGRSYISGGAAMTDPRGVQWKPGASATLGWVIGASDAKSVGDFLKGSGNQAFVSFPTGGPLNVFGAVTHSYGGATAIELGVSTRGKLTGGVVPISHARELK